MNDLMKHVLATEAVAIYPTIGLVILSLSMLALIGWTFRPKAKEDYKKQGTLTLD